MTLNCETKRLLAAADPFGHSIWAIKSSFFQDYAYRHLWGWKGQRMALVLLASLIFRIAVRKRFSCSSRRRLSIVSSQLSCWAIMVACMAAQIPEQRQQHIRRAKDMEKLKAMAHQLVGVCRQVPPWLGL